MSSSVVIVLTGVDEIDRQHGQLVKCLNDLTEFVGSKFEFAAVFTAINTLLDYTVQHFAYEEELLASANYPLLEQHIAEHKLIKAAVLQLWDKIEAGNEEVAETLVSTIRTWIIDHINAEDVEYSKYLKPTLATP